MTTAERELQEHEAYGLLLLISLIWAGNFMAGKLALQVIGPITLTALRALLASVLLLWYVRLSYPTWPLAGVADLQSFVILAVTGLVCNTTLWYYGLARTLAVNAAIVGATGPIFVAILSATWLRERLTPANVAGIVLSSVGVILTVTRGSLRALLDLDLYPGDVLILAGQGFFAVYSVYARQVARRFAPTVVTTGSYLVSAVLLVPMALVERPWTTVPALGPGTILAILYAAVPVTLSHIWFYWGIRVVPAPVAALTVNLLPFEVLALSWLFLDEPVTWIHVMGALIVIAGVLLATRKPAPRQALGVSERPVGPGAGPRSVSE
ncbi:MAG TPA: DMT family transporter [Methylomirabilota bacterium]|nr:DMT family transporter [Methylomirabilota bacterium]